jgi:hypothetical protein
MSEVDAHIVFFDTSALVKRYHREVGTDMVEAVFSDPSITRMISESVSSNATLLLPEKCAQVTLPKRIFTPQSRNWQQTFRMGPSG